MMSITKNARESELKQNATQVEVNDMRARKIFVAADFFKCLLVSSPESAPVAGSLAMYHDPLTDPIPPANWKYIIVTEHTIETRHHRTKSVRKKRIRYINNKYFYGVRSNRPPFNITITTIRRQILFIQRQPCSRVTKQS